MGVRLEFREHGQFAHPSPPHRLYLAGVALIWQGRTIDIGYDCHSFALVFLQQRSQGREVHVDEDRYYKENTVKILLRVSNETPQH